MFGYKIYTTVIMEGSSKFVNREIVGMIDMVTRRMIGKSKCRSLDRQHPTMKVVKRFTNASRYRDARRLVETYYPGVCAFDVDV